MSKLLEVLVIRINPSAIYLSDDEQFHAGLPSKCIFDKGKTGCGGTTIALTSADNYVIAVPFIALVRNKESQNKHVLGVYGNVGDDEIQSYCESNDVKKIIVTYDSLERVMRFIKPSEFKLLVDEYHILFTQYGLVNSAFGRKAAVKKVLNNYDKFSDYCFMSATPLEDEFILDELKGLTRVSALWQEVAPVKVYSVNCEDVLGSAAMVIMDFMKGDISGNGYVFINSLSSIERLIKMTDLQESLYRVIYSDSNTNEYSFTRSQVAGEPKLINFITSAAFEGVDFYDEKGRVYIVSDPDCQHSLVDISTSFMQIAGRIRNSKYSGEIVHLYATNEYSSCVPYDEYKEAIDLTVSSVQSDVKLLNQLSDFVRDSLVLKKTSGYLTRNADGYFEYDPNYPKVELYQYRLTRIIYDPKNDIGELYGQHGFEVIKRESKEWFFRKKYERSKKLSFRESVEYIMATGYYGYLGNVAGLYHYVTDDQERLNMVNKIIKDDPLIEDAITCPEIGYAGIERLGYNRQLIKREVIKYSKTGGIKKVAEMLISMGVKEGSFYPNLVLKELIGNSYKELAIKAKAKSADIERYFNAKKVQSKYNGKVVWGWTIISRKDMV